ncbi:MAG: hypothetical protein KatS3mg074_827 [Meiothermus sp.]|uniref:Uncharacterized protein n=2 Tax=Meiothermus hypogaeus TaxID=884155 RepID=A0A511R7W3_9DEIN|nr:hypothetical protein [Meiothermus hypogaeus]RIH74499.1 hypothetical protein Mhypo_03312 [Meiothermus hypogaeus]GEM85046.1 hypothetical protein MHY01S_32120 [Meiothermus hypogaeus NBRC 106114]GIW38429.1 MAG: hypothetical protein KatS3mg074_827 [Meiothermus sp.]
MIFLSLVLPHQANLWANTLAAVLTQLYVVGGCSASPSYLFFALAEVLCMAVIVGYVWRGRQSMV